MTWGAAGMVLKDSRDLTPAQRAAVAEVSQTITKDGGTIRLKLHDKAKALSEMSARLWPVPKEPEKPTQLEITLVYADRRRVVDAVGQVTE